MTDAMRHKMRAQQRRLEKALILNCRIIQSEDCDAQKRSAALSALSWIKRELDVIREVLDSE